MKIITATVLLVVVLVCLVLATMFAATTLDPAVGSLLFSLVVVAGVITTGCFVLGEVTGNCSQTDKVWSLAPIAYVWLAAWQGGFSSRLVLMACLVTLWGLRLSFNFYLKGGYSWKFWTGEEDYRWAVLRKRPEFQSRWKWTAFNLLFIAGFQNALVLMMTFPIVVAFGANDQAINTLDYVAAAAFLMLLIFETVADWQQWRYQIKKKRQAAVNGDAAGDSDPGFLNLGLWSLSRHPNYFAEQAIWVAFYMFAVAASGYVLNWSIVGCVLLIVLFRQSSMFSEEISAAKYPQYKRYQETVPRFLPLGRKLF